MGKNYIALLLLLIPFFIYSQDQKKSFVVKFTDETINPDGLLDESVWQMAKGPNEFQQYFPTDSIPAIKQTQIKMLYSNTHLYVGIKGYAEGPNYNTRSLQRDFRGGGIDQISLVFDTFNDNTNAFLFGINPFGVRREALITGGGGDFGGFTTSWDVKWKGDAKIYDDYFTAEMAIPLTSFKFKEGETKWQFNSYRLDMQTNERSTYAKIPQNQPIFGLAFMADMIFEKGLGKSRTPIAIIPYMNGITARDYENNEKLNNFKVGGDAKVSIGNSLNLDLTLNPDFSTVEVDNFITNLTRFEVRLPERRQFFVDNNDLFGGFGGGRDANPFFSRRIGIASDTVGNTIENRIIGGLRLSGKLNRNLRLGFLNIQTEDDKENLIPSNNNMMLALQQKVFSRSNIGLFFINRQRTSVLDTTMDNRTFINENNIDVDSLNSASNYNRVIGIDYNLASADNSWIGKAYAHKSFQPGDKKGNYSLGLNIGKNTRYVNAFLDLVSVDEEFTSDLGFIPRRDIFKMANIVQGNFWPKRGKINRYQAEIFSVVTWRPSLDFLYSDYFLNVNLGANFKTLEEIGIGFQKRFVFLTSGFDPSGKDEIDLPANTGYHFNSVGFSFESDERKLFNYRIESNIGQFFNGNSASIESRFNMRFQPKVELGLSLRYDHIDLPNPYSDADIWLISPRATITFSKAVFWSTLVQYSNQRDNLGINSRLQWRFAPLSDLFIVYNDNYFVDTFSPRFRSINLKLTYWLNI